MNYFDRLRYLCATFIGIIGIAVMLIPFSTHALESKILQSSPTGGESVEDVLSGSGLGDEDPVIVAQRIVSLVLGLLALIAAVIILYAGVTWMTAAGNEDRIENAQHTLKAAVIGLVIIIASWSITLFVIGRLIEATDDTPRNPSGSYGWMSEQYISSTTQ